MIKPEDVRGFDIKKRNKNPKPSKFSVPASSKSVVFQSIFRECKTTITGAGL
ncbi:hypothetical protein IFO69_10475 [Echinicola sp. CAU 1574]|uniref:Uncharacterized protein n=1 Tax=Echinicola arenosa TaxID=2774144 RepID=A0ABR9AMQ4_9BACT|nr:hypothetical protein [Echinicola arenosa]MBD8489170.1 hypothetical protein [Echinicola arenosa]